MRRNLIRGCVGALVTTLLVAGPASADSVRDAGDARGRLDITFASAVGEEENALTKVRVDTEHGYSCRFLARTSPNRLFVLIDLRDDGDIDVIGRFLCRSSGDWRLRTPGGDPLAFGVRHRTPTKLVATIGWEFLPGIQEGTDGSVVFRSSDETSAACRPADCKDRAPNSGHLQAW